MFIEAQAKEYALPQEMGKKGESMIDNRPVFR